MNIHPSSVISPEATLADDVEIGPFCVVEGKTTIGSGTVVLSHARIGNRLGTVTIGQNNTIYPNTYIGGIPQDLKYTGEDASLCIGDGNVMREGVTINIGTALGGGVTRIGNQNLLMANTHIGHDCELGDENIISNAVNLAGHVKVASNVRIGGMVGITQFVRLGQGSFIAACSAVNKDIVPFAIAEGNWATIRASNKIGMERLGYAAADITELQRAIRILTKGKGTRQANLARIEEECLTSALIQPFLNFILCSERGIAL